jgi:FAD/FMN-containing dehydrogenase
MPYTRDAYANILRQQVQVPDFVVMPQETDEVQKIVQLANAHKVPVYPRSFGAGIAGSALPYKGGIVVDLKRMNRIIEVNEETMTATIQPGVTWDRLRMAVKKKKLDIIPIGGPYETSPIGNFLLTNITPYSTKYCMDRAVTLEAVLPNGEILRTGSQCTEIGAKINPYFRYAYGPDITGLFRGSLGNFGIITQMVIRLRPLADIETCLIFGFDELPDSLKAFQRIERLEITRYSELSNKDVAVRFILHPEQYRLKTERLKVAEMLAEYTIIVGIGGNAKQIALYTEMITDEAAKQNGRVLKLDEDMYKSWEEVTDGASQKVLRMFEPYGSFGTIVGCAPISSVVAMNQTIRQIVKKHELMDPILGEPLTPELLLISWDRCSTVYCEHEILYDPLNQEDTKKAMQCLRDCYVALFSKFGACHTIPNQTFMRMMMPSYTNMLLGIKKLVDPNGIMLPGGPYSFEPLS